jgi:hypothetical protein
MTQKDSHEEKLVVAVAFPSKTGNPLTNFVYSGEGLDYEDILNNGASSEWSAGEGSYYSGTEVDSETMAIGMNGRWHTPSDILTEYEDVYLTAGGLQYLNSADFMRFIYEYSVRIRDWMVANPIKDPDKEERT